MGAAAHVALGGGLGGVLIHHLGSASGAEGDAIGHLAAAHGAADDTLEAFDLLVVVFDLGIGIFDTKNLFLQSGLVGFGVKLVILFADLQIQRLDALFLVCDRAV